MHKSVTLTAALALLLATTGCSYSQFSAVATGSSLGGMFGSSIGGLLGGPRGADAGAAIGMLAGGAAGAAIVASKDKPADTPRRESHNDRYDADRDVAYDTYNNPRYNSHTTRQSDWSYIEVTDVTFLDNNGNHRLDGDETAYIAMSLYNRSGHTLYNVSPLVTCSDRKVLISPTAIISSIPAGGGVRYKAAVRAPRRLRHETLTFSVCFGQGRQAVTAKTFSIRTDRH